MPLSEKDREQIKFNTELLKLTLVVFAGTFGTSVSLLLGGKMNGGKIFFCAGGLLVAAAVLVYMYTLVKEIQKTIDGID